MWIPTSRSGRSRSRAWRSPARSPQVGRQGNPVGRPLTPVADLGTDRDADLVDALRRRDPTAAERLIARYGDRAYRLAIRITGNAGDAEEVVQDVILRVVRKIDTFRGESAFGSWFYRIVSNAACGRRRAQASIDISLDEVLPAFDEHGRHASLFRDWSSSVDDPAVQQQLRDVLTAVIDELPPRYRAAIVLRDVEGLPTAEVAEALGIPVSTAKTRAHRARLLLRKRLSTFILKQDVARVAASAPQTERVLERAGLMATR